MLGCDSGARAGAANPPLFPLGPNPIQIFRYRRLEAIFARRGKAQLAEDGTLAAASLRRLR